MRKETYVRLTGILRDHPKRAAVARGINVACTAVVFASYPVFLIILLFWRDIFIVRAILVPAISFVALSIFRAILNWPRPYEMFDIPPVLKKDSSGRSFPSRHVFSVFVIAATLACRFPRIGLAVAVIGFILAVIRVIGGVHSPRDVIVGAAIGVLCGVVGYMLIPGVVMYV